ncbi:hypothetical protein PG997_012625 [Apiospora hydei]|uniref:Uncharacterized protein n=1 Tax=Apiospora hydei TaxID=1337664 RepID=A0ABR1V3W8_9PEZI
MVVLPPPPLGGAEASGGLTRLRWDMQDSGPSPRVQCQQHRGLPGPRGAAHLPATPSPPVTAPNHVPHYQAVVRGVGPGDIHRRAAHRVRARILAREPSGDVEYDEEDIRLLLRPEDREQPNPIRDGQAYERA